MENEKIRKEVRSRLAAAGSELDEAAEALYRFGTEIATIRVWSADLRDKTTDGLIMELTRLASKLSDVVDRGLYEFNLAIDEALGADDPDEDVVEV